MGRELIFLILTSVLVISGCSFHSGPEEKIVFSKLEAINQLSGVYENKGDPRGFLSRELWRRDESAKGLKHKQIDLIAVETEGESVFVKAVQGGCVIFQKQYLHDRDFEITEGKIVLKRDFDLLTRGGDDPMLGPSYEKVVIGLDEAGHGAYRTKGWGAGIIYGLVPIAASGKGEIRFNRSTQKGPFPSCGDTESKHN